MNGTIKNEWCAALESGEYTQCQGVLKKSLISINDEPSRIGHCCLGVLCEIVYPGKFTPKEYYSNVEYILEIDEESETADLELTDKILEQIGMDRDTMNVLIEMNDDQGKTFPEIAQYIRENL
jgi:hypothetical protein